MVFFCLFIIDYTQYRLQTQGETIGVLEISIISIEELGYGVNNLTGL